MIIEECSAQDLIQKKIKSREWWIIPMCSEQGRDLGCMLEEKFYAKEKNEDFELFMGPIADLIVGGIAFAKKIHMTAKQLSQLFNREISAERDCLFTPDCPHSVVKWIDNFDWK